MSCGLVGTVSFVAPSFDSIQISVPSDSMMRSGSVLRATASPNSALANASDGDTPLAALE